MDVSAFTDSIAIADVSGNKVTTTLVGGKRSLDVNVTDITLSGANDSVAIGDGTNNAAILTTAPASDTGQSAIAVRIISQLGAGGGAGGGLTDTQLRATAVPVSTASLPLPAGASTSALQTTGNASLASLDTKAPALGQALAAASVPVVLTAAQLSTLTPLATVAVTGPLTDTQIRATALPVSGTFFQATQPVSALSLPLPSGAATETTLAAINTKVPALGQALAASSTPVVLTAAQITTLTPLSSVSVSNFPATQAVSGPLTDTQLRLTPVPISGTVTTGGLTDTQIRATALPVSGTFFQATQPVSAVSLPLPAGASTETTLAALNTKVTAVNTGAVTISAALPTGANTIGTVNPPAITKGTQGTVGITTQDLKDAGRNPVHFYMVIPVLTSATDTLQSLTGTKAGATVVATTTPAVVTAGKTLRITRLAATYVATATSGYGIVRLRFNTAGLVAITSPVATTLTVGAGTPATANSVGFEEATITDGWEFAAATGIGISVQGFAAVTATAVGYVTVSVTGYEY